LIEKATLFRSSATGVKNIIDNGDIMHNPAHSVVHLTIRKNKINLAVGTGVLYLRDNQTYIVTAWYNISGRHTETLELLSKKAAIPNNIVVSFDLEMKQENISFG
jgi:hypothetical protein